ncbi:MAG: hypothetical protein WCO56_17905 [Verrucomicrobiota bacterium]
MPDINKASSKTETMGALSDGPAWQAAAAAGFDMSLIELNLAKTPWERLQDHDEALAFASLLQEAMQKRDAKT